jgi:hypothetical protein
MAVHDYTIDSAVVVEGRVSISGSVDGTPVSIRCFKSQLQQINQDSGIGAVKTFIAQLLLQAVQNLPQASALPIIGSFSQ